jgi:hypothetical protein
MSVISAEQAISIIQRAFSPLRCGAEVYDYNEKIRLNVFNDTNESLLKLTDITRDEFSDTDRLGALLERLRENLADHKGVQLESWKMPVKPPAA